MSEAYEERSIVNVCTHCGATVRTFLTPYDDGFAVNSYDVKSSCVEGYIRLVTSSGIPVYMNSGKEADYCFGGYFANSEEWREKTFKSYIPLDKAEANRLPWATVNTKNLIDTVNKMYKEDAESILRSISGYVVRISWDGTDYCNDWNK